MARAKYAKSTSPVGIRLLTLQEAAALYHQDRNDFKRDVIDTGRIRRVIRGKAKFIRSDELDRLIASLPREQLPTKKTPRARKRAR